MDPAAVCEQLSGTEGFLGAAEDVLESEVVPGESVAVTPRVDAIILTGELAPGLSKPHPRAFELMADRLGAAHNECIYVADNPAKDFVAPNALGWTTIRIVRPDGIYKDAPPAEQGAPRHVITLLDEIDDLIG